MPDYTAGKARILLEPTAAGFYTKSRTAIAQDLAGRKITTDVSLRANVSGFYSDAESKLRAVRELGVVVRLRPVLIPGFRRAAREEMAGALAGLYATVKVTPTLDFTRANEQMMAWRLREQANPLRIRVLADVRGGGISQSAGARDQLGRLIDSGSLRRQSKAIGDEISRLNAAATITPKLDATEAKASLRREMEEITRDPKIKPKIKPKITIGNLRDNPDLRRDLQQLQRDLDNNFKLRIQPNIGGVQLRLPLGALGFDAIPAIVASVGSLIGALTQLSGVALAVPGALAVAGSSVGAFAVGLGGLGDAWKALQDEQQRAATQSSTDTDRIARSQDTLRNSLVDQRKAQEDLTRARKDARRELEDLHSEERSNTLSVAEAAIDLRKARNELAQTPRGGLDFSEALVREARARETLDGALRRQRRGREDANEADAKGISQSDKVTQALDQVARANQQVAAAQRAVALETRGAANAADKSKYFMDRLSPSGQELLRTLAGLEDTYLGFRNAVQEPLFRGLSAEIHALINADLPVFQKGLSGIATAINTNIVAISKTLQTPDNKGFLERIFGNTEEAHRRLNGVIDPLINSVLRLSAAGSDAIPRLITGLAQLTTRFAGFIEQADKDGRLDKWIDNGIDGFLSLGRTIGNVARIISGVGRAFGGNLIGGIEGATKKLADFLNSAQGQRDLLEFINSVRDTIGSWRPILEDLPGVFRNAMDAGREAIRVLLPVLNIFTEVLEHCPGLITAVVTAFVGWGAIRPVINATSAGITGISTVITELGSGFALSRSKADEATKGIDAAFGSVGKAGGGPAKAAGAVGRFASLLGSFAGPAGAIAVAAFALGTTLVDAHNDAADAAERHKNVENDLASTLERVTKAAGAATLARISTNMEDFQPGGQGLGGNVRQAVQTLGIDPTAFASSILPGGEGARGKVLDQLRAQVRPTVDKALRDAGVTGIPTDLVVDAFLGDQAKVAEFRDKMQRLNESRAAGRLGSINFDLGDVRGAIQAAGGKTLAAGLAGQFLNDQAGPLSTAVARGQAANRTATGAQPTLSALGRQLFGSLPVEVGYDGRDTTVRVTNLPAAIAKNLAERNNQVEPAFPGPNGPVTVITLTGEDASTLVDLRARPDYLLSGVPGFAAGGPTPSGRGTGPTGGHYIEAHDDEWVLPKHARRALGDEWLWDVTRNKGIPRRGSYDLGGPVVPPPIPPLLPGQGLGPPPGPPPEAVPPPAADPAAVAPVEGVSHAGGPGAPFNADAVPATDDPYVQQYQKPDIGKAIANQFLAPWGFQMGADGSPTPIGSTPGERTDPGTYVGKWGANLAMSFGETLLDGVLGFFGLSTDNAYFNAFKQTLGFYSGKLGKDNGGYVDPYTNQLVNDSLNSVNGDVGYVQLPDGSVIATTATGQPTANLPGSAYAVPGGAGGGGISIPAGDLLPVGVGDENRLQVDTAAVKRAVSATFPVITDIGGYREDPQFPDEHPSGKAIDVMIPKELVGTPQGQVLGDAIVSYVNQHASEFGVDYSLWQQAQHNADGSVSPMDDRGSLTANHGDHVHIQTAGGGLPTATTQYIAPSGGIMPMGFDQTGRLVYLNNGSAGPVSTVVGGPAAPGKSSGPWWGQRSAGGSSSGVPPLLLGGGGGSGLGGLSSAWNGPIPLSGGGGGGLAADPTWSGRSGPTGPGLIPAGGGRGLRLASPVRFAGTGGSSAGAPPANYKGGNTRTYAAVYRAFREAGFNDRQWPDLVNILNHESNWKPTVSNPSSGAFGLFQFLGSTQKAYLPDKNPDPYVQARAGMRYIGDRYGDPAKAWNFWQAHQWYDRGGLLRRGVNVTVNDTNEDEIVVRKSAAVQAKQIIDQQKIRHVNPPAAATPPPAPGGGRMPAREMAPPPPPEADIAASLPPQGVGGTPVDQPAPQTVAPAVPGNEQKLLPAISTGISSGAATLGNLASTAASVASLGAGGAGAAGPLISGLFQQGGKIVEGLANAGAAFASGWLNFGGTTTNPYGVQLRSNEKPPPLATDQRRTHVGNNYFASMDDWRRRTQLQDAQDQQASLARVR